MEQIRKKRIYVDMDDTICDFSSSYRHKYTHELQYPQSQIDFFRKLKPIKNSLISLSILSDNYDVWILTRPSIINPMCYTEKRLWVEDHLGIDWCKKLIICPDKSLMIGDYLIDDKPWTEFKGTQLLFGSDKYPDWESILKYFKL